MTSDEGWLAAMWPFVRAWLPSAPARVLEIGCGPLGGFVPALSRGGYDAVGVDPEAPEGPGYHRVQFERYQSPQPVDCVVACTSLHHVGDLDLVLDLVGAALVPDGAVVVVEWAWERFDEATARWCFARLAPPEPASEPAWLHRRREDWAAAGQPWDACCQAWATHEGLHTGRAITRALDARFDRRLWTYGPYFFADLLDTTEADEQAAIDAGQIHPDDRHPVRRHAALKRVPARSTSSWTACRWPVRGRPAAGGSRGAQIADRVTAGSRPPWRTAPAWRSSHHRSGAPRGWPGRRRGGPGGGVPAPPGSVRVRRG